ncbi:efflux RND transporter permease subunit [Adhaeribacter sp. BT258]|uniref:Efflux RND transporter permease subunit n=1 Tax=Adhaeribacter terrigena TaxID=2793070 RepID=A0ABS1C371_9BACT|nr:CusA/CzcA family heavy metal efflux RND transporter [Adhaeribacter terrigena]MBK0403834.1 efflux RND transporter permease subunit [Adhaeribacter terrigena]
MNSFIRNIIAFSLKNRFLIFFATFIIIVAGVISYKNTPIEAFPDVTNTRVQIITQWPGRSAEEVEKFVTIPLEVEMNVVPKKTSLRSISLFGLSVVTMIFDDEVDEFTARQLVANQLAAVNLPDGVDAAMQPSSGPTGEIFRYTLESSSKDVRELKTIQDWVIDRQLKSVPGIADVVSFGGEVKTYEVRVDPSLLAKYGISALEVYEALAKSNINVGGDVIEKSSQAYVVRGIGLLNNIPEIENVIVDNRDGVPVLVRHIGEVQESHLPSLGYVGRDNETNLVEGIVVMRKNENPSEVLFALKLKIVELNDEVLPEDVKIKTFYDRSTLIGFTTSTVTKNLLEGIILVTAIVFLFMADWRTTLIVSIIIPLALLFAFVCMRMKGMSANLLSMGAIDFGIIIDGAVVMVEGLFVVLDKKAHQLGMKRFNKLSKQGMIKNTATDLGKSIFFSKLIIITALLPIFAFQKVEGKMFSPLAYTLGFALLGALIFTLTLVPVLASMLLNRNVREKHNPIVNFMNNSVFKAFSFTYKYKKASLLGALGAVVIGIYCFRFLGSEFLPQLNEGAVYVRASMPMSTSLDQSIDMAEKIRKKILQFDEVNQVLSQTGRPNDGTDPTGFFNIEFHVDLKPKDDWNRKITQQELISEISNSLGIYQGIKFNFSQPIMDNVEEAVSGVKGSMAVKIFGNDLNKLEVLGDSVYNILNKVEGIDDLGVIRLVGQPELQIQLDQSRMAAYGVNTADCQAVIEMAIGGKAATKMYEGERNFDIRLRYQPQFRQNEAQLGNLLVPTSYGSQIPLKEIAKIGTVTGPAFVYREENARFIAIKFSVRGRDLGSTIKEAQDKVAGAIQLDKGMKLEWKGEFENQIRATERLSQVAPISLVLIFLILFVTFGNVRDAGLVILNVPFALIGGILALLITQTNFSISAGVGFIALFGICIQNGVILISVFKKNVEEGIPLIQAIKEGVAERTRPVLMTAMMAALGLLPAALSTGIGSETQKPLAIVVIGGLITGTILTLLVFPLIVDLVYKRSIEKAENKRLKKILSPEISLA